MQDMKQMIDAIRACNTIREALSNPRHYAEPTITLRGIMVNNLEQLIYREGWHKSLRFKIALLALKLIR